MSMENIIYKKLIKSDKYKYELIEDYTIQTPIVGIYINTKYITLTRSGLLIIKSGYQWDGPSGPTIDTKTNIIPSLVHDALYQLIRLKLLSCEYRYIADYLFYKLVLMYGMFFIRAKYYYYGVRLFGAKYAGC